MQFNLSLGIFYPLTVLGFVLGVIPLLLLILFGTNQLAFQWRSLYDMDFLPLMIVADILFVLYFFQCFKRCHDLGKSGLYCLIPMWNPIALLFSRGDEGTNKFDRDEESEGGKSKREKEKLVNGKTN